MNQTGKMSAEPPRIENKRERRRGAAGRAAALRRAPSDSDCSGETASLSADSGERTARQQLPPPRSGKTRNRRRGSEWEVLEGLKDGQRFDKRPDVFNGYLHKKRKWPLKGWHKRFFVIDGGILVYARSPADVARGRLHGSVDVGLSVISAKARRRRIDIDADEFIYHLRAKTPEVFRTWLNILKAHRLYRQHLLTFGARESVPKIHAPIDDLPATDNSSRTTFSSSNTTSSEDQNIETTDPFSSCNIDPMTLNNKHQNSINNWRLTKSPSQSRLLPLDLEMLEKKSFDLKFDHLCHTTGQSSLCSMKCVSKRLIDDLTKKQSLNFSLNSTDAEKQMLCTEINSFRNTIPGAKNILPRKYRPPIKKNLFAQHKPQTTTCFFFTRKKNRYDCSDSPMKKSRKCTNLVKYRNISIEPPLKQPSSKCLLLGKYTIGSHIKFTEEIPTVHKHVEVSTVPKTMATVQVQIHNTKSMASQNVMTLADFDKITEDLMKQIFKGKKEPDRDEMKFYIDQVVRDLYDVKLDKSHHPVKALFRSLLEYWLKNTSINEFKEAMTNCHCVDRPSNKYFMKDENLSSYLVQTIEKETQFHGVSEVVLRYKPRNADTRQTHKEIPRKQGTRREIESFEKERRIQELERLLKNTVYVCETKRNNICREKDIKITKKLIDNLEKKKDDTKTSHDNTLEKSSSSTELPEIQETINHLISETAIPPDVAKEFLGVYLDVLLHDISTSTTTSQSSDWSSPSKENPNVEVVSEAVTKKVSKSILTLKVSDKNGDADQVDPGQIYLKDVLDKITTIFSKAKKPNETWGKEEKPKEVKTMDDKAENITKDELGNAVIKSSKNNLIYENCDENSLVIDLSKYNLENIAMFQDQTAKDMMSITIRLKEKPPTHGETNQTRLNLRLSDNPKPKMAEGKHGNQWITCVNDNSPSTDIFCRKPEKKLYPDLNKEKEVIDLKPYFSNSDATSKAYRVLHKSSLELKTDSLKDVSIDLNDDNQCYIMSIKGLTSNFQSKKKVKLKDNINTNLTINSKKNSVSKPRVKKPEELTVFEKPAPRIIDEKFILLLLENLMLLSKNVPSLYKDINSLYLKLRKKHEKVIKNCSNIQGLSLLGKIYNEEPCPKLTENTSTQYDSNISHDKVDFQRSFGTNTYYIVSDKSVVTDDDSYYHTPFTSPVRNNTEEIEYKTINARNDSDKANSNNVDNTVNPDNFKKAVNQINYEKHFNPHYFKPNDIKAVNQINFDTDGNPNALNKAANPYNLDMTFKPNNLDKINLFHLDKSLVKPNDANKAVNTRPLDKINPNSEKIITNFDKMNTNFDKTNTNLDKSKPSTSKPARTLTDIETIDVDSIDESTSAQNWFKKECTIGTLLKYVFDRTSSHNYKDGAARPIQGRLDILKQKAMRIRQNQLKKPLVISSFKVSSQSQTERQFKKYTMDKSFEKDFDVYQLYMSKKYNLKGSCSEVNIETNRSDDLNTLYRCSSGPSCYSGLLSPSSPTIRGPQAGFVSGTPGGRLASWIIESGGPLENASRELGQAQLSVQQLQRLLDALELQQQVHHDTDVSLEGASPNVKKDRRKFGLRKKKSNSKCASVELAPPHIDASASHTALSALTAPPSPGGGASSVPNSAASLPIACAAARPQSLPGAESLATAPGPASLTSLTPDHQLREDFTVLAKDLVTSLKGIVSTLVCERGRLRAAMETTEATPSSGVVAALRTNLSTALHQNSELRSRLSRIHDASDIAEICSIGNNSEAAARQFQQSLSYSSSCVSASEFFDAEEHDDDHDQDNGIPADEAGVIELDGDSSSEAGSLSSEEGSASSDNSDGAMASAEAITLRSSEPESSGWTRRTRLPAPRPVAGGPSLWNLLYKNIGKDLSQISMPVTINEPLNMLQRLCEELEYCELLDAAASARDAVERAALVAAFAVSAYSAAAHRAASKPFNPLLAETYECVRDDKGFRFLAEQVSHHPPISACHAESPRWCFWQEARIKTKFWGKSMEFQPTGRVHVRLNTTGDHYTWNKVTTCVHNLFGGQRWVDQYGDMHITCVGTDITCKLSFIKASSWSQSRHEVRGAVGAGRGPRLRLAGRWSEALYAGDPPAARCLWRPGAMPPEHEMYYGFTRFAMELNEMEPGMKEILPHTDTRFRPDQRALEEGDVDTAETLKHELEQAQRERRRDNAHHTPAWFRKTIEDGEETWVFSNEYWKARENGFPEDIAPRIW